MKRRGVGICLATGALSASALLTTACASDTPNAAAPASTAMPGHGQRHAGLPSSHVHGVGRDPGDGALLLATHEGLFRYDSAEPTRVGPNIDLMGFTIAGPNHYYASGHPNAVMELPQPMGLIESTDGGRTWTVVSRGGESDFHALAKAGDTVLAFDGQLRRTANGSTWSAASMPAEPRFLASSPTGGRCWPRPSAACWCPPTRAQLGHPWRAHRYSCWSRGRVSRRRSASPRMGRCRSAETPPRHGGTTGKTEPAPQALSASMTASGLEVLTVAGSRVLTSKDGVSFTDATE